MSNFLYSNLSNNSVTIIDTSSNVAKKIYLKKKKSIMHEVAGNTWYLKKLNKRHTNKDNFLDFQKKIYFCKHLYLMVIRKNSGRSKLAINN